MLCSMLPTALLLLFDITSSSRILLSNRWCSLDVTAHGDNQMTLESSHDNGYSFEHIDYEHDWQNTMKQVIHNVDENSVLRFTLKDLHVVGGFVSTVQLISADASQRHNFITNNPLTDFKVLSSDDGNPIISHYTPFGSGAWRHKVNDNTTPDMDDNAYWVWNGNIGNTMVFELKLADHLDILSTLGCISRQEGRLDAAKLAQAVQETLSDSDVIAELDGDHTSTEFDERFLEWYTTQDIDNAVVDSCLGDDNANGLDNDCDGIDMAMTASFARQFREYIQGIINGKHDEKKENRDYWNMQKQDKRDSSDAEKATIRAQRDTDIETINDQINLLKAQIDALKLQKKQKRADAEAEIKAIDVSRKTFIAFANDMKDTKKDQLNVELDYYRILREDTNTIKNAMKRKALSQCRGIYGLNNQIRDAIKNEMCLPPTSPPTLAPTLSILDSIQFDHIDTAFGCDSCVKHEIGWKKIMFCNEGHETTDSLLQYGHNDGITFNRISDYMELIAPYAVAVKIVPDDANDIDFDNYAVYGKVCQNPIIALNNLKELSYTINVNTITRSGPININDWFGATSILSPQTCDGGLSHIKNDIFHACGNVNALHIQQSDRNGMAQCEWDYKNPRIGKRIAIYFGFDKNKQFMCDAHGNGGYKFVNY